MSKEYWFRSFERHLNEIEGKTSEAKLKNPKHIDRIYEEAGKRATEDLENGEG